MLTLTQSANETGLTRSAIFKAIKSGRLSATKDPQGRFLIDPVELFRVYQPATVKTQRYETQEDNKETAAITHLTEKIALMGLLLTQVQGERDDLRLRLDQEALERRQLLGILTQPVESKDQKCESDLYQKLFKRSEFVKSKK